MRTHTQTPKFLIFQIQLKTGDKKVYQLSRRKNDTFWNFRLNTIHYAETDIIRLFFYDINPI